MMNKEGAMGTFPDVKPELPSACCLLLNATCVCNRTAGKPAR